MFADAVERIRSSFFPLIREIDLGNNQKNVSIVGTGFFVGDDGLFVTAHHVIAESPAGSRFLYGGILPDQVIQPVEIRELRAEPVKDIFVGRVPEGFGPKVEMADASPRIGSSVCLCGYPMPVLSLNQEGINVQNVRKYYQPTFALDYVEGNVQGRHYEGFITQHNSFSGMSGGPVFDREGVVYGMDVASWTRTIPQPDGNTTLVQNGVAIYIRTIRAILEGL